MAVTTQYSTEYDTGFVTQDDKLRPHELGGRVKVAYFKHTQSGAGDATSSAALVKLPPGRVRVLASMSKAYFNWTTASATADIGWDAYTDFAGDEVSEGPNGIDDGIDVDVAGFQTFGSALTATGGTKVFESQDGVVIRATSQDVAIADGDVVAGFLLYVPED